MKFILLAMIFLYNIASGQINYQKEEPQGGQGHIDYMIVWRTWDRKEVQNGDIISFDWGWNIHCATFLSISELSRWLNTTRSIYGLNDGHPNTLITENQFIMAYDFIHSKQIEIKFTHEHKFKEKHIEVEKEDWEESKAEIKL